MAWRDYWQNIWIVKREAIEHDLKSNQTGVKNHEIPDAILNASTGIIEVDNAIETLYTTGYMHNHMRMYVASICCNISKSHWLAPAKWMYSHLLDGDLASNHLSWQWVAGTFSNKKYYANQDNINQFFESEQKNTFLDVDYSDFEDLNIPDKLKVTSLPKATLHFPESMSLSDSHNKSTLIYNYYNIDPYWHHDQDIQRIFLIEPSFFKDHHISQKCLKFALDLTKNIENIQIYVGEFSALNKHIEASNIIFKEHPTNSHYKGQEAPRTWMSNVKGYYPSFFTFWKKCKKEFHA